MSSPRYTQPRQAAGLGGSTWAWCRGGGFNPRRAGWEQAGKAQWHVWWRLRPVGRSGALNGPSPKERLGPWNASNDCSALIPPADHSSPRVPGRRTSATHPTLRQPAGCQHDARRGKRRGVVVPIQERRRPQCPLLGICPRCRRRSAPERLAATRSPEPPAPSHAGPCDPAIRRRASPASSRPPSPPLNWPTATPRCALAVHAALEWTGGSALACLVLCDQRQLDLAMAN